MALEMTCADNHWHKLSSKLWLWFPGRKNWQRLKLQPGIMPTNRLKHCMPSSEPMGWLCSCPWAGGTKKANESYRM